MAEREPAHGDPPWLTEVVDRAHSLAPARLLSVVRAGAAELGASHAEVWLVDWQQEMLTRSSYPRTAWRRGASPCKAVLSAWLSSAVSR